MPMPDAIDMAELSQTLRSGPKLLLVDEITASASETFIAAVQGITIGRTTFGKALGVGIFLETQPNVRLNVSGWLQNVPSDASQCSNPQPIFESAPQCLTSYQARGIEPMISTANAYVTDNDIMPDQVTPSETLQCERPYSS